MKTESFIFELDCTSKEEAIRKMIDALEVGDPAAVFKAVMDREALANTCIDHGIAIPHGKTDAVGELSYVCARAPRSIDWGGGRKAGIVVLTLSPTSSCGPHVLFLAHVAKLLENPEVRRRIMDASSVEEMREAFELI